jgi:hypothetical protein
MGVVGITCVACVGVFVAGGSLIGTAVGIGTTTAQFYTDLQAGQYESAHALLGEELASQYSSSDLQTAWENLAATGPVKFTVGGSGSVENGRAVIPLIFTTSSGTRTVTLTLQQAGKNWKITGADPSLIPEP